MLESAIDRDMAKRLAAESSRRSSESSSRRASCGKGIVRWLRQRSQDIHITVTVVSVHVLAVSCGARGGSAGRSTYR